MPPAAPVQVGGVRGLSRRCATGTLRRA